MSRSALTTLATCALCAGPLNAAAQQPEIEHVFGGAGEQQITVASIVDVALHPRGVLLLDREERRVLFLNRDGGLRRTWGREGAGPGEFEWPSRLGLVADSIWVVDASHGRITMFDPEGTVLGTSHRRSPALGGGLLPGDPAYLLTDGSFAVEPRYNLVPGVEQAIPRVPILRVSAAQEVLDTIAMYSTAHRWWPISDPNDQHFVRGRMVTPNPFGAVATIDASSDGRYLAWTTANAGGAISAFTLAILDAELGLTTTWSVSFRPTLVSPGLVDAVVAERTALILESPPPPLAGTPPARFAQWAKGTLTYPESLAPVTAIVVDANGDGVWTRREMEIGDHVQWVRYAIDGTATHRFRSPKELDIREAVGNELWGVLPDELDVPSLVKIIVPG